MEFSSIPFFILGSLSVLVVVFLLRVIRTLNRAGEKAMASFQLNPGAVVRDFELFLGGSVVLFGAFASFLGAGLTGSTLLLNVGRAGAAIYIAIGLYILYRWWRRF